MTEPLLLALMTLGVAMLIGWCERTERPDAVGIVLALACLTRYEAWPVTYAALAAAAWARWRRGDPIAHALRGAARIGIYPTAAIAAFAVFSRIVIGQWLVTSGFFVAENKAMGRPMIAAAEIAWGTRQLSGTLVLWTSMAGVAILLVRGLASRRRADALVALALVATAVLPWGAFVDGHPFRIRYMVPLLAAEAVGAGVAVGIVRAISIRAEIVVAAFALAAAVVELHPMEQRAPMVVEAQWDRPNVPVRRRVTDCLVARYDGDTIMASMGSLGHYMQETSRAGLRIRDFLHEGNGDIWLAALDSPRPFAGWILIEEKAEGGDMLARRARADPRFLDGFSRVCGGAGLALYRRDGGPSPAE
jgi:hypothetical protein